jgi:hypothetical protein
MMNAVSIQHCLLQRLQKTPFTKILLDRYQEVYQEEEEEEPQQGCKDKIDNLTKNSKNNISLNLPFPGGTPIAINRKCLIESVVTTSGISFIEKSKITTLLTNFLGIPIETENFVKESETLKQLIKWLGWPTVVSKSTLVWVSSSAYLDKSHKQTKAFEAPFKPFERKELKVAYETSTQDKEKLEQDKKEDEFIKTFLNMKTTPAEDEKRKLGQWFHKPSKPISSTKLPGDDFESEWKLSSDFESRYMENASSLFVYKSLFRVVYDSKGQHARVEIKGFFPSGNLYSDLGKQNNYELETLKSLPGFQSINPETSELTVTGPTFYSAVVNFALVCLRAQNRLSRLDIQEEKIERELLYPFIISKYQDEQFKRIFHSVIIPFQNAAPYSTRAKLVESSSSLEGSSSLFGSVLSQEIPSSYRLGIRPGIRDPVGPMMF